MNTARVSAAVLAVVAGVVFWIVRHAPDGPTEPASGQDVTALVNQLDIAAAGPLTGYSRDQFPHWSRQGQGCDTRELLLVQRGHNVHSGPECRPICDAQPGEQPCWRSPYDDRDTNDPADLQIDHVVPLAEAWRSGAATWTLQDREHFANDPNELLAVTGRLNEQKRDKDPTTWMPPAGRCLYLELWVTTKHRYHLSVDPAELGALRRNLADCPPSTNPTGDPR